MTPIERATVLHYHRHRLATHGGTAPEALGWKHAAQADRTAFALAHFDTAPLPRADIVVACGALCYRCADPHWVFNLVARMYAAAETAFVFTMLDATVFPEHPLLVGHDIGEMAAFASKLAQEVDVVRGYAEDDAALVMRRPAA